MLDVILYATDTMADWEYGYLTTGLAMADQEQPDRFRLRILADGQDEVTTAGRLRLRTDGDIGEVAPGPDGGARAARRRHLVRGPGSGARSGPDPAGAAHSGGGNLRRHLRSGARGIAGRPASHQQREGLPGRRRATPELITTWTSGWWTTTA